MQLGSVEGFLLTLLVVVPGGLGMRFRRYTHPAEKPSAFAELLQAVAASVSALVVLEFLRGLISWPTEERFGMGSYLVRDIIEDEEEVLLGGAGTWGKYVGLVALALVLPWALGKVADSALVRTAFGGIAKYERGFEDLFEARWTGGERPRWATVKTTDGRLLQGQVAFRSTAPHPPELTLKHVRDVTYPSNVRSLGDGFLWIPNSNIVRVWMSSPAQAKS